MKCTVYGETVTELYKTFWQPIRLLGMIRVVLVDEDNGSIGEVRNGLSESAEGCFYKFVFPSYFGAYRVSIYIYRYLWTRGENYCGDSHRLQSRATQTVRGRIDLTHGKGSAVAAA